MFRLQTKMMSGRPHLDSRGEGRRTIWCARWMYHSAGTSWHDLQLRRELRECQWEPRRQTGGNSLRNDIEGSEAAHRLGKRPYVTHRTSSQAQGPMRPS